MQTFPFKETQPITFVEPLRTYIEESYQEDPKKFSKDLLALENLRNEVSQPDIHVSCLNKFLK
jgi:programmed cell death 6-interacting protein